MLSAVCDFSFRGAYAVHQIRNSQGECGCDLRHFELCVSGVRRKDGRTRQGVQVSGRMLDGLASDLGAILA